MTDKYPKHTLRKIAGKAYEKELSEELDKLLSKFKDWKSGKLDVWNLERAIHEFHQKPSRELFKIYANVSSHFEIKNAITNGLIRNSIKLSQLPKEARKDFTKAVDTLNKIQ